MASDQQFCLRWNNHQSTLVSVFDNLLESQTLVDCTLAADGQYLKAHKVVLSACSPYLEAILCQNLDKHPILILKDVKFSELKAMLDYMYRGEVNISQEQLSTFLKAAESLQIKGLTDSGGGGGGIEPRERELLKRQELRKPLNQPVPHIPQPRPVVPHPGLLEPRRSLPHFPPHIADMQPQSPRHAREGSTSPTARKRRRPNRPSSDDSNFVSTPNSLSENHPDTSDSCDVPVKQSVPSTASNVPNSTTKAQETDSPRTTPQPQNNSDQKQIVVKKEFAETLLTPKTELDYGNDNSMEDVNYEDDEDEEVDLSKPGTSFATNNQGFPPWQMGGDGSNDDNSIYSPDVSAAGTQNNSQGIICFPQIAQSNMNNTARKRVTKNGQLRTDCSSASPSLETTLEVSRSDKKARCFKCNVFVHPECMRLHSKYYCGTSPEPQQWIIVNSKAYCLTCKTLQTPNVVEFHVKYVCKKKPMSVQCLYCPKIYSTYKSLLRHMTSGHKKNHCFLDLMSILPEAEPILSSACPVKVIKHFFNCNLSAEGQLKEQGIRTSPLQVWKKTVYTCGTCGKVLEGIHAYQNHVNTKCDSLQDVYSCFFCMFKADYPYKTLDHMESDHNQHFNTYDLIQAQLTGIIPALVKNGIDECPELDDGSIATGSWDTSANHRRFEGCSRISRTKNTLKPGFIKPKLGITKKKRCISKIICQKCCEEYHPDNTRIHKLYYCGKKHVKRDWVLKGTKALCLMCKTWHISNNIDFHVKHNCSLIPNRPQMQCFYCPQISDGYRNIITHMKKLHNKSHYLIDFMTILPDPKKTTSAPNVIHHPFLPIPNVKKGNETQSLVVYPSSDDFHACFECEYVNKAAYKVLEHMQEIHYKKLNLYDLLRAKMSATF